MLARSSIALTRTRRCGEGGCAPTAVSDFRPSEPDQRLAAIVLGGRAWESYVEFYTRMSINQGVWGQDLFLLSGLPFLLLLC